MSYISRVLNFAIFSKSRKSRNLVLAKFSENKVTKNVYYKLKMLTSGDSNFKIKSIKLPWNSDSICYQNGFSQKLLKTTTLTNWRSLTTTCEHFMPSHTKVTHNDESDTRGAWPYRFKKYTNHSVRATAITLSNRHIMAIIRSPKRTVLSELQRVLRSSLKYRHNPNTQRCAIERTRDLIPCTTLQIYPNAPPLAQIFFGSDQLNSFRRLVAAQSAAMNQAVN